MMRLYPKLLKFGLATSNLPSIGSILVYISVPFDVFTVEDTAANHKILRRTQNAIPRWFVRPFVGRT